MKTFHMLKKISKAIAFIIGIGVFSLFVYCVFRFAIFSQPTYFDDLIIKSPDGTYALVIKEWESYTGDRGAEIYYVQQEVSTKIGQTDKRGSLFREGFYQIEWEESYIVIKYMSGQASEKYNDPDTWIQCRCDLP